jgi:hypothetical protein
MADRIALGNVKEPGSIRLDKIRGLSRKDPRDPMMNGIEISFKNVVGSLQSPGLPAGFVLLDGAGKSMPICYKTRLEGNRVILETSLSSTVVFEVAYGYGYNPICNITDARGMAIPQFGPISSCGQKGSDFLVKWKVSGPVEGPNLKTAAYLAVDRLAWRAPHSVQPVLVMPQDVYQAKPGIFYLRTFVQVSAARQLKLSMGADSPYRIWINGRPVGENLKATNPSNPDEYPHRVEFQAGRNEILVAFDGRTGQGWGISMRFLGIKPKEQLDSNAVVEES